MIRLEKIEAEVFGKKLFTIDEFTFHDGKKYVLTGENGTGKSTLLKSFVGLNDFVKGKIISDKDIVYQAQNSYIFKKSPRDNFKIIGVDPDEIEDQLRFFEIENLIDQDIDSLSGGEREKVVFLRSILKAKETLLLDEPFSQMDKRSRINANIFLDKWLRMKDDRMVILISHGDLSDYTYDYHINLEGKKLRLC